MPRFSYIFWREEKANLDDDDKDNNNIIKMTIAYTDQVFTIFQVLS